MIRKTLFLGLRAGRSKNKKLARKEVHSWSKEYAPGASKPIIHQIPLALGDVITVLYQLKKKVKCQLIRGGNA